MGKSTYIPRQSGRVRFYQNLHTCEHVWEHRPWDVFKHRCAKCGAWAKVDDPPALGRKREVIR